MAKYRKKSIEVEAVLLEWKTWDEVCDFLDGDSRVGKENPGYFLDQTGTALDGDDALTLKVCTAQGQWVEVKYGEWIIAEGPSHPGRYYPCDPDIFEATYEPVEAASSGA